MSETFERKTVVMTNADLSLMVGMAATQLFLWVSFWGQKMGLYMGQPGMWLRSCVLLELLLGPCRCPESPGTVQEELPSYGVIRFRRELKLCRLVVPGLGSTEPKSSTEGCGGQGSGGAAGGG